MKLFKKLAKIFRFLGVFLIRSFSFKFVIGSLVAVFLFFLISYNYTFVQLKPEYSGEEFARTRIGPISVELPASYSHFQLNDILVKYQGWRFKLSEFESPSPCEIPDVDDYESNVTLLSADAGEDLSVASAGDGSTQYPQTEIYQTRESTYAIKIIFDGGCAILGEKPRMEANSPDNKELIIRNFADIFVNNYQWVDAGSDTPKGFKTKRGVIKMNDDLKVSAEYVIFNSEYSAQKTTYFIINFLQGDTRVKPREDLSIFEKFVGHILIRLYHNIDLFFGYDWTYGRRDVTFLASYSEDETIKMWESENGVARDLIMSLRATGSASGNCFSDRINVTFVAAELSPAAFPPNVPSNILYGYWDKFISSAECVAY
ncbi:MAG: hypothetical protein LBO66_05095 [Deltaproteobacteria bacterium]|jgi:hypothetical protein|nr:hypothetical protein [Deltaproteobacteria bacterium]